jgi:hypothetical protein
MKLLLLALPVAVLIGSTLALPVYAHDGESSDDSTSGSSGSGTSGNSGNDSSSDDQRPEDNSGQNTLFRATNDDTVHQKREQARERAKELISEAKDKRKEELKSTTDERRQKRCEARKTGIINRTDKLTSAAKRHLAKVDSVFAKVKAYKDSANLSVDNYDELVSKAASAQTTATASVEALESVQIKSIDCTPPTISDDIATFKAAVTQARNDLKTYRQAVKDVLSAVESAKEE